MSAKKALLSSAAIFGAFGLWAAPGASAAEFNEQCPGPTNAAGEVLDANGQVVRLVPGDDSSPAAQVCQHVVGGDGFIRMADGTPLYSFGFSPVDNGGDPGTRALKSNLPAPLIQVSEGQQLFLTMSNVPFVIRPDLFDPHSVHWHGFPNAASAFDGLPDSSVSPNPLASMTYFYNVVNPGTFMWHCHVEAAEHMQMGMLGNLYVKPKQNYMTTPGTDLGTHVHAAGDEYAYNDGDGSTFYDHEYPIQIHSFDPAFHNASHDVQPLPFADMDDRYAMLNGRGYPDTIRTDLFENGNPDITNLATEAQPMSSLIEGAPGEKVLIRFSSLSTVDYYTLVSPDLPMQVVGQGGEHRIGATGEQAYYKTHQVTLGGGQAYDVLVEIPSDANTNDVFFLFTSNMNQLANDGQDYGGMMTEIHVTAG